MSSLTLNDAPMCNDRITVIGIGPSGRRAVRAFRKAGADYTVSYGFCPVLGLLDADDTREAEVPDVDAARGLARRGVSRILHEFRELDPSAVVVLVASMTEAIGVGVTPLVAEALANNGVCVVPVVLTGEGATARLAMRCLSEHAASMVAIDPGPPVNDTAQAQLALAILTVAENGPLSVGTDLLRAVYAQAGRIGRFSSSVATSMTAGAVARASFDALPARARHQASAYVVRVAGGQNLRLLDAQDVAKEIAQAAPYDATVLVSLATPSDHKDRVEVGIVALGVDPPEVVER